MSKPYLVVYTKKMGYTSTVSPSIFLCPLLFHQQRKGYFSQARLEATSGGRRSLLQPPAHAGSPLSSDQPAQGFILLSVITPQGKRQQLSWTVLRQKKKFSFCLVCTSPLSAYTHYFSVSPRACLHLLLNHNISINKL